MISPDSLLKYAVAESAPRDREPDEVDFRRAVSTCYYAVFHELCSQVALAFAGATSGQTRMLFYRALNHASLRVRWDEVRKSLGTPEALKKFAEIFTDLQLRRHACDYDPGITIFASDAHLANQAAREAIELLRTVGHEARRDFLSQLLLGKRAG